jgi:hypothetical protein
MFQESWDALMAVLWPSSIFKFNYGTALREIAATFITSSTLDSSVLKSSLVWFFSIFGCNRNRNRNQSFKSHKTKKLDHNQQRLVFVSFYWFCNWF